MFDIADPLFAVLYLFVGGDTPLCLVVCDVNGDEKVDLGDVVYMLNTLFREGPAGVPLGVDTPCDL